MSRELTPAQVRARDDMFILRFIESVMDEAYRRYMNEADVRAEHQIATLAIYVEEIERLRVRARRYRLRSGFEPDDGLDATIELGRRLFAEGMQRSAARKAAKTIGGVP
jgi:hypothetical protein